MIHANPYRNSELSPAQVFASITAPDESEKPNPPQSIEGSRVLKIGPFGYSWTVDDSFDRNLAECVDANKKPQSWRSGPPRASKKLKNGTLNWLVELVATRLVPPTDTLWRFRLQGIGRPTHLVVFDPIHHSGRPNIRYKFRYPGGLN